MRLPQRRRRRVAVCLVLLVAATALAADAKARARAKAPMAAADLLLPRDPQAVRFAVIGDSGSGGKGQKELAARMLEVHALFPYEFAIMLGDNLYGGQRPEDYQRKFEGPYRPLLDAGVRFYAALGNHDNPSQRFYKNFSMNGERYYSFKAPLQSVRFFALDSNYLDPDQIDWVEKELGKSDSEWKICFFHHPIYSSGKRHGPDLSLRAMLELRFITHGVDVVFTGHEHLYERLQPQNGIAHFISGSAAKVRRGGIRSGGETAKGYDQGLQFMAIAILGDEMHFQVINERGETVDSGRVLRRERGGLAQGQGEVKVIEGLEPQPEAARKP